MTLREKHITNIIRSRGVAVLLMLAGAWMVWRSPGLDPLELPAGATVVMALATGVAMVIINRQFNLLHTTSLFFAGLFMVACGSTPIIFTSYIPVLLAAVVVGAMWFMFTLYNRRRSDRRLFLVFTLISAGALLDWSFLFYIPVFVAGIGQMRIFRFKKILAAIVGIITPWWITIGLGILPFPRLPHIFFTPPSMLAEIPGGWPFVVAVAFTLLTGFFTGSINLLRILGFNARSRAVNGLITTIAMTTGLLAIVNFTHLDTYVVILNACTALQVGHFFRATAAKRGYIFVLFLLAVYTGLYIWGIMS